MPRAAQPGPGDRALTHDPRIILSPDVAYVLDDDAVYVAVVPEGPIRVLEGAGAIIWEAIGDHRRVSEVIAEAADQAGLAASMQATATSPAHRSHRDRGSRPVRAADNPAGAITFPTAAYHSGVTHRGKPSFCSPNK